MTQNTEPVDFFTLLKEALEKYFPMLHLMHDYIINRIIEETVAKDNIVFMRGLGEFKANYNLKKSRERIGRPAKSFNYSEIPAFNIVFSPTRKVTEEGRAAESLKKLRKEHINE